MRTFFAITCLISLILAVFLLAASPAHAAILTEGQIQAIVGVVSAFTNNQSIVVSVERALRGISQLPGNNIVISSLSTDVASPGAAISIVGTGFTGDNAVYLGNRPFGTFASTETPYGQAILFTVPGDVAPDTYAVTVSNAGGSSNALALVVHETSGTVPHIKGVAPDSGPSGTEITITGTGFNLLRNTVYTSAEPLVLPSPDGATITFTLDIDTFDGSPPELKSVFPTFPIFFIVENERGKSNEVQFDLMY